MAYASAPATMQHDVSYQSQRNNAVWPFAACCTAHQNMVINKASQYPHPGQLFAADAHARRMLLA